MCLFEKNHTKKRNSVRSSAEILTEDQIEYIRNCDIRRSSSIPAGGIQDFLRSADRVGPVSLSLQIVPYQGGAILRVPQYRSTKSLPEYRDDRKLYEAFIEEAQWNRDVGVWVHERSES